MKPNTNDTISLFYYDVLNPHGSDETTELETFFIRINKFLTHTVQMKLEHALYDSDKDGLVLNPHGSDETKIRNR